MNEIETWGVTYERYALERELIKLKEEFMIETVAEMPAHGAKAMPSAYSIGFAVAGAKILLINGVDTYLRCWEQIGLEDKVEFLNVGSIYNTDIPSDSFDLVWNFAYIPMEENHPSLLAEMKRLSKRYVSFFSVNFGNIGFLLHRALHKIRKVPWTHGDVHFNKRRNIAKFMKRHGLKIVKKGFVDCPIWPDSPGFRDMRLHRENISFDNVQWTSPYINSLVSGEFPLWLKLVYAWEKIPTFSFMKTLYAHINYVIGEKLQ